MSGITNPAEEYFKDGLWGWVTNAWKKLVATAGGALHIQFAGQEDDVEVKQTTPADLTPGVCGWDGSAWHKLPMVWGYSAVYVERKEQPDATAPDQEEHTAAVLAGYVYVVTNIVAWDDDTNVTDITIFLYHDGSYFVLKLATVAAVGETVEWSGRIVLDVGDYVHVRWRGVANNDNLFIDVVGYGMKIAE